MSIDTCMKKHIIYRGHLKFEYIHYNVQYSPDSHLEYM